MIIGHKKQIKFLENSLREGNTAQTYLFSGPERVGKFFIARIFAEASIKGEGDLSADFFGAENKNPDLEILAPETVEKRGVVKSKAIEVEKIREAQKRLGLFPAIGRRRVLIIDDAHKLLNASQNALLKNLEEPNSSAIIILVTHKESLLLKTVRSRCQKVNFNLVALEEIRQGFGRQDRKVSEKMIVFSMGRPGEVERFLNNEDVYLEREAGIRDLNLLQKMSVAEKFNLAESYAKNINSATEKLEFWIWMIRVQAYKNLNNPELLKKNYAIISEINRVLEKIKNPGLNARLILENLFLTL
ncbi:MAG: AAA family ATPase [Candidatus Moraniibacteriota bacterium]